VSGLSGSVRWRLAFWNTATFAVVLVVLGVVFRLLTQSYLLSALDRDISVQARRLQEQRVVNRLVFSGTGGVESMTIKLTTDGPALSTLKKYGNSSRITSARIAVVRDIGLAVGDQSEQFQYRMFDLHRPSREGKLAEFTPDIGLITAKGVTAIKPTLVENQPWDKEGLKYAVGGTEHFASIDFGGTRLRVLSLPLRDDRSIVETVQIAAPLAPVQRDIQGLTRTLLWILPPALLICAVVGVMLTDRALRPVKQLTFAATNIRPDQLGQRLPVSGTDEFDTLAAAFNVALDRVETAFDTSEQMMQQLRRFTGDASHELRTPLTTIKTNTGVALAEIQPSQEHIHALRQIDKAADRMTGVIDDLLLLARSDAGQMTESRQNVPVLELVQEAIEILKPTMSGRELDISGCSAQVTVSGAPTHLVRLFQNLLENASRYSPEARPIIVTARENGKNVLIQFIDGGPGVETEHLCHLGERFYRADTGRSRQQGGVGLGLAICKSIVSAHGGEIRFASAPGSGLTVSVVLPTS